MNADSPQATGCRITKAIPIDAATRTHGAEHGASCRQDTIIVTKTLGVANGRIQRMPYIIRDTKSDLWQAFKARAAQEGRSLRFILEALIARYVKHGLD